MGKGLQLLKLYNELLFKYPITTKAISAGMIMLVSDITCQVFIEKKTLKNGKYSFRRTLIMSSVQGLYGATIMHFWYNMAVDRIATAITTRKLLLPIVCTVLDQSIWAWIFWGSLLFGFEFVDKRDFEGSVKNVKDKIWEVMIANWKVWTVPQLMNFAVVPAEYRVLFRNVVGLFWNVYLSWIQNHVANERESVKSISI